MLAISLLCGWRGAEPHSGKRAPDGMFPGWMLESLFRVGWEMGRGGTGQGGDISAFPSIQREHFSLGNFHSFSYSGLLPVVPEWLKPPLEVYSRAVPICRRGAVKAHCLLPVNLVRVVEIPELLGTWCWHQKAAHPSSNCNKRQCLQQQEDVSMLTFISGDRRRG